MLPDPAAAGQPAVLDGITSAGVVALLPLPGPRVPSVPLSWPRIAEPCLHAYPERRVSADCTTPHLLNPSGEFTHVWQLRNFP